MLDPINFFLKELPETSNVNDYLYDNKKLLGLEIVLNQATNFKQNSYHNECLYEHLINTYNYGLLYTHDPIFAMECLFHDIGKIPTRKFSKEKNDYTFHKHEYIGSVMVYKWMNKWKFNLNIINRVVSAIKNHQYRIYSDTKDITIKKWLQKIGPQTWEDIRLLRLMDRMANEANKYKPVLYKEYIISDKKISGIAAEIW